MRGGHRRGLLIRAEPSGWLRTPETNSLEYPELLQIGETLRPMLGRHFLVLALLQQRGSGALTRRVLEEDCQLLTQRLTLLHGYSAAEIADKSVFAGFVANLLDSELLREDDEGLLHFDEHLLGPLAYAELVLPADARQAARLRSLPPGVPPPPALPPPRLTVFVGPSGRTAACI
mgnify:CR=1 FL=1